MTRVFVTTGKVRNYYDVPDEEASDFIRDHQRQYAQKNGGKMCPSSFSTRKLIGKRR